MQEKERKTARESILATRTIETSAKMTKKLDSRKEQVQFWKVVSYHLSKALVKTEPGEFRDKAMEMTGIGWKT